MGWNLNAKSMTIPEGSVKKITDSIGRIIWQASSGVTYTPILTDNTSKYPLYLNGYKIETLPANMSDNNILFVTIASAIDTSVEALRYCDTYRVYDTAYANLPDPAVRLGTSTYKSRVYIKDTGVATTYTEWNDYLSSHKIKIFYKEYDNPNTSLWFAVQASNNTFGYYCPATGEYFTPYEMTGTKIERVEYTSFDGTDCHINTGINLTGADTVIIDFLYEKSGSNIFGSWRSSNNDVYTLYASTSKSYTRYGSSLYRNLPVPTNTRVTYKMTPAGNYLNNTSYDTWSQLTFDSGTPCLVGWLYGSSSPHMSGCVYDFTIEGSSHLIPVKIGALYYMFDCLRWSLPEHHGTFDGGQGVDTPIEFPTSIPERSSLLTMGGNPFSPDDEEEPPEN